MEFVLEHGFCPLLNCTSGILPLMNSSSGNKSDVHRGYFAQFSVALMKSSSENDSNLGGASSKENLPFLYYYSCS